MRTAQAATQCAAQRPGPGRQGVTVGSAVAGLALAVPPVGGVAVSEAGLVGSLSVELPVGAGTDVLGVVAEAVVSGDAGCVAEGDTSGCADALTEADGEIDAEGLVLGEGTPLLDGVAAGFTTGCQ